MFKLASAHNTVKKILEYFGRGIPQRLRVWGLPSRRQVNALCEGFLSPSGLHLAASVQVKTYSDT